MTPAVRDAVIALLEKVKHDHYSEPEGLSSCPAASSYHPGPCDCGADKINAEIDAMIDELRILYGDSRAPLPAGVLRV